MKPVVKKIVLTEAPQTYEIPLNMFSIAVHQKGGTASILYEDLTEPWLMEDGEKESLDERGFAGTTWTVSGSGTLRIRCLVGVHN